MKLHYVSRDDFGNKSFTVTHHCDSFFLKVWHYHPELELVLTLNSTGTRFVGDSIKKFEEGDLVLIGKNLPHMWLNDDSYFSEDSNLIAEDYVIHFKKDFLGKDFFQINEMKHIDKLLYKSNFGIKFFGIEETIKKKIEELPQLNDFEKTIGFLKILNALANHKHYELLASSGYINSLKETHDSQLDKVYEYIFENFSQHIALNDVADIANMNPSAFSRLFKRLNRKTFSKFLIEVRIGYASKLLMENRQTIASICYESGFNNISNFNRQFKQIKGISPREYQKNLNKI